MPKRQIIEVESSANSPERKRRAFEPKSPKSSIRDASERLVQAVKLAERISLQSLAEAEAIFKAQVPKPSIPVTSPCVYFVNTEVITNHKDTGVIDLEGVFSTLEEANKRVRNECLIYANRDDPNADFFEMFMPDGGIFWENKDKDGSGHSCSVAVHQFLQPGSEPNNNWGRPVGEPCPSDDEDEEDVEDNGNEEEASEV